MPRPFPKGRVGLKQLLAEAGISKNTFFLKYRYEPRFLRLFDIQEDRDHRLHFPEGAGRQLAKLRGKRPHGNVGRKPQRGCPSCGATLHPRHRACVLCGWTAPTAAASETDAPPRSTAVLNFRRRRRLEELRAQGKVAEAR